MHNFLSQTMAQIWYVVELKCKDRFTESNFINMAQGNSIVTPAKKGKLKKKPVMDDLWNPNDFNKI